MNKLNIIEAFIKYNKKLVIFITGLSGCGKSKLSEKLSKKLNLKLLNQFDYYKEDYDKKIKLPDNTEHINWSTDDAIDWDTLNKDIKKYEHTGIILSGFALPKDKVTVKPDYFIGIAIKKDACINKRSKYIKAHKDQYKKEFEYLNTQTEKLIMNMLIFPYFLESNKRTNIDKFINYTNDKQLFDDVWDTLFNTVFTNKNVEKLYWDYMKSNKIMKEENIDVKDYNEGGIIQENLPENLPENLEDQVEDQVENIPEEPVQEPIQEDIYPEPIQEPITEPVYQEPVIQEE